MRPSRTHDRTVSAEAATEEPGYDGRHTLRYGALDPDFLLLLLSREQIDTYINVFWYSEDRNYGALCEYFGISSGSFARAVRLWKEHEATLGLTDEMFEKEYPELSGWENWFGDYKNAVVFLADKSREPDLLSVTERCESDSVHTDRYFTIDRRLIQFVGTRSFEQFRAKYAGSEQFNVLKFIDFFEITKDEYISLCENTSKFREDWISYPYSPEYLFGDAEKQRVYFCRDQIADSAAAVKTKGSCQTHTDAFHEVSYFPLLDGLITSEQYYSYMKMFRGTEDINYGAIFDYFGVSEQQYREQVENVKDRLGWSDRDFKTAYPVAELYDAWFSPDRGSREEFVWNAPATPSVTVRDPEDEEHTDRYFTIDSVLIDHVGRGAFEKFRSKYAGTASFNILAFLEEFDISKSDLTRIFEKAKLTFVPYSVEGLFPEDDPYSFYVTPPLDDPRDYCLKRSGVDMKIADEKKKREITLKVTALRNYDKAHLDGYLYICYYPILSDLISREDFDKYCMRFSKTADMNYGALIRYFGISRADYEKAVEKVKSSREYPENIFTELFGFADRYDEWFSDDYESFFLSETYDPPRPESITVRPPEDTIHTDRYFTIDSALLRFVGEYGVGVFTERFAGTEYFNVINYLGYFEINRDVFNWLYRNADAVPYNTDYIYPDVDADPDEVAAYFLIQTPTPEPQA